MVRILRILVTAIISFNFTDSNGGIASKFVQKLQSLTSIASRWDPKQKRVLWCIRHLSEFSLVTFALEQ